MDLTKKELVTVIAMLKASYPKFEIETEIAFNTWYASLKDIDFNTLKLAVAKCITESPYIPTIATLRKMAIDIKSPCAGITGDKAWSEVKEAIRRHGYYNEAKALESMSDRTRRVVKRFGYRYLCTSENEMADRAHFIKAFDSEVAREREQALMAPSVRHAIESNRQRIKQLAQGIGNID